MEIISSKPTIISAIHKIKSNKGAMTAGIDEITIRTHLPYLPINDTNRTNNLATVCIECHKKIHNQKDYSGVLERSINKKLNEYRDKLIKND